MGRPCVAVAFSGGRDSAALLHATVAAARGSSFDVIALHVHHGLLPEADVWQARARALCSRWARRGAPLRFDSRVLHGAPSRGESVEAWARQGRYAALADMARANGAELVLLGHHRRDQAETFLLQALRGGGVAGLAAMPARVERDGLVWARPWLGRSRESIDAYVRRHRLGAIEDPSNADARHARNRLRLEVMPALLGAFPQAEACLSQAAAHAHEAAAALEELAAMDMTVCAEGGRLRLDAWLALSPARRSNTLRAWLLRHAGHAAPASLVARLLTEWPRLGAAGRARWPFAARWVHARRGTLELADGVPATRPVDAPAPLDAPEVSLAIAGPGSYRVDVWGGALQVSATPVGGVDPTRCRALTLRARQGGERFQAAPGRPARNLKKQFQAAGIEADGRGAPLCFAGSQLVYVPGLGVDGRAWAPAGAVQWQLLWVPDAAPGAPTGAAGRGG